MTYENIGEFEIPRQEVTQLKIALETIAQLQADNAKLREALKRAAEDLVPHRTKPSTYAAVNAALGETQ